MKPFLSSYLLLLGLLASCTVYHKVVHPYRLPTPEMTPEAKAKYRAAEKARHKGTVLKTDEAATDAIDPNAPPGQTAAIKPEAKKLTYSELPVNTRYTYDKQLLLKKPKLKRRRLHTYDTGPLTPRKASRDARRYQRSHAKGKNGDKPTSTDRRAVPEAPDSAPASPDVATPEAQPKAPKEVKEKAPKVKKSKKVPVPKPDPTQPTPQP